MLIIKCIIVGVIIGAIVTFIMVSSMKSVHKQSGAAEYRRMDKFKLDDNRDVYLYNTIEETPRQQAQQQNSNQ